MSCLLAGFFEGHTSVVPIIINLEVSINVDKKGKIL